MGAERMYILLVVVLAVVLIVLITAYICFRMVFYSPERTPLASDKYEIPEGEIYEPFREEMIGWVKEIRAMGCEDMSIKSFDGLTLRGKYYECNPSAPVELLFHGYQGNAERDLSGGVKRCFALGRNALIIDQRSHGTSDGSVITFGINEFRDCLSWIDHAIKRFGNDVKLIICGVSMGAATVMMAAGEKLPSNVVCVLADCGYTSPKEIIKKVIREMHFPADIVYLFVKLGASLFGHFDLEENSPIEAMKKCTVPIIFAHGDADEFVPCEMSRELYEVCTSEKKKLVTVKGAGHGLAFPVDKELYLYELRAFADECGF